MSALSFQPVQHTTTRVICFKSGTDHSILPSNLPRGSQIAGRVSNPSVHWNHLQGLLKHRLLGPMPRVSDSVRLGWGEEFAFLATSQVMLMLPMLPGQGLHFEKHRFK